MAENIIQYTLTATVDDEVVFKSEYADTTALQEELRKAESAVGTHIEQEKEFDDSLIEEDEDE